MALENPSLKVLAPNSLRQMSPSLLGIEWNDGHHSIYPVRRLRLSCRCASCVDEWTSEKLLDEKTVPADIKPKKIESIGRYALKVVWSDGHDTGFYTFDQLRALCECPACKAKAPAPERPHAPEHEHGHQHGPGCQGHH